jgi:hypothetical protein
LNQLFSASLGPSLCARGKENFHHGIWKNSGPHVSTICDESGRLAELPLSIKQGLPNGRQCSYGRSTHARFFAAYTRGDIATIQLDDNAVFYYLEFNREGPSTTGYRYLIIQIETAINPSQRS